MTDPKIWTDEHGNRIGNQRPRLSNTPQGTYTDGPVAAALYGMTYRDNGKQNALDEWQSWLVDEALQRDENDSLVSSEVLLLAPRQNGKNISIEAVELYNLYLNPKCRKIIHTAHRYATAREAFTSISEIIRSTPELIQEVQGYKEGMDKYDRISGIKTGGGRNSIRLKDGSEIEYMARTPDNVRGFTGDMIVLDEAFDLNAEVVASLLPTMAARSKDGDPQVWYTSSAGKVSSEMLASLRERGMEGKETGLFYAEWSTDENRESDDVAGWYEANPGLGIHISEDHIRDSEYNALPDEQFRRERLGIWAPVGGDAAIASRDWAKLTDEFSTVTDTVAFAVDVPPSRDHAVVSAASLLDDGRIHVELIERKPGTDWVAGYFEELNKQWDPVGFVVNSTSPAGTLISELSTKRLPLIIMDYREYTRACANFYDLIREKKLTHIGQEELAESVQGAKMKFSKDTFTWARREPDSQLPPMIAATMAAHVIKTNGEEHKKRQEIRAKKRRTGGRRVKGIR